MIDDLISRAWLLAEIAEDAPLNWCDTEAERQEKYDYDRFCALVKRAPAASTRIEKAE